MVDFGRWDMPIQYRGIRAEHLAVRSAVGVFDLSHMGRLHVRGADALRLVQWLTTNDASRLGPGRAQYSLICGDRGQILDDIIVYNRGDELLLVVNASNRIKILAWIDEQLAGPLGGVEATVHDATFDTTMIGFQGPESERLLQELVDVPLETLRYYASLTGTVAGRAEGRVPDACALGSCRRPQGLQSTSTKTSDASSRKVEKPPHSSAASSGSTTRCSASMVLLTPDTRRATTFLVMAPW